MSTIGKWTDKLEHALDDLLSSEAGKELQRDIRDLRDELLEPIIAKALGKFKAWVPANWQTAIVKFVLDAIKSAFFEKDEAEVTPK
jgi:hypothetical protein